MSILILDSQISYEFFKHMLVQQHSLSIYMNLWDHMLEAAKYLPLESAFDF